MTADLKIETTLFYTRCPASAFYRLPEALQTGFATSGVEIQPLLQSTRNLVFGIGGLTLTVGLSDHALDTAPLRHSERPLCTTASATEAQSRLAEHSAAVSIRITGPDHAAKAETRLALVYLACEQMLNLAQPDMLHWAKSDMLYTIEEFRSSTGGHRPVQPRPATHLRRSAKRSAPRLTTPAEIKGRSFIPGEAGAATPFLLTGGMRAVAQRGALAAMTVPFSLGHFLQHLLPGARLG